MRTAQVGDGNGPKRLVKGKHDGVPGWVWVVVIGVGSVLGVAFIILVAMFWNSNGSDGPYQKVNPYPECEAIVQRIRDDLAELQERERNKYSWHLQHPDVSRRKYPGMLEKAKEHDKFVSCVFLGIIEWGDRVVDTSDPFSKEPKIHIWVTYGWEFRYAKKPSLPQQVKGRFILHRGQVIDCNAKPAAQ
jgi:hypothetical protein